jgi:hypothetical protein
LGELLYQYFLCDYFGDAGDNLKKAGTQAMAENDEQPLRRCRTAGSYYFLNK